MYVVDNGSTDQSGERIRADFPEIQLLATRKNLGVAGGFNAGIAQALEDGANYILILNNDTVVAPDMPSTLLGVGEVSLGAGILMPKILHYGDRGRVWSAGARCRCVPPAIVMRGLNRVDGPPWDAACTIAYAPACGLLIPRRTFVRAGLFDDGYFFYFEDWDFSLRVRQAGLDILYVPQARLYHKVSRTVLKDGRSPFVWRTWGASAARYYRRFGQPATPSAVVHLGYLALRECLRSGPSGVRYFAEGAIRSWREPLSAPPQLRPDLCHE